MNTHRSGHRHAKTLLALLAVVAAVGLAGSSAAASSPSPATAATAATAVKVNGASVKLKVTTPNTTAKATFTGQVGESITAAITDPHMSDDGDDTITLRGPDGVIDSNENVGNGNPVGIGPDTLSQKATYTITFKLDKGATGSGTLWVSTPVSIGTVGVNKTSESMGVTRVGQGVERSFTGTTGEQVTEAVTGISNSDDGDDWIYLIGPDGVIDSNENVGNGNPIGIGPDTLTEDATYTVLYEVDNTATGTGTLWVSAPISLGTITVNGASKSMDVSRVGQGVERNFSGTKGEKVRATVSGITNSDDGDDWIYLIGPNGVIDSNENVGNGNPVSLGPHKLPATTTYTILYEVDNTATGVGKLTVTS